MIKRVSPAVVNIATRGTVSDTGPQNPLSEDPFFRRFFNTPPDLGPKDHAFQSAGSGVIFNAQSGYILTNAHVVENATEITAEKGVLTIRGQRHAQKSDSANGYERVERVSGAFLRRFSLPESAETAAIKAKQSNGVLEITIPKSPQVQPQRISVEAA